MAATTQDALTGQVADTTADGRGVITGTGKTIFLDGAIGGETVSYRVRKRKRNYDEAELVEVLEPSPERVAARCSVFGVCGGCALQHVEATAQLRLKESVLFDNLQRIGGLEPDRVLAPITGPQWGYRRKARLGVKYVAKKGRVLVGFRERHAPYVTDTPACETLDPAIGQRLPALAELIQQLSLQARIPQVEVAIGDNGVALVFRVLDEPTENDLDLLRQFAADTGFFCYLQTGGPDTVASLPGSPAPEALHYGPGPEGLELEFQPTDFVQVNQAVNQQMVARAIELLEPTPDMRLLDLFCGLGNFSLALAQAGATVVGLEGSTAMVDRATANAARNGIKTASFAAADLAKSEPLAVLGEQQFDSVLLDPPRAGAAAVLDAVAALKPERILYVSCHPGTLARDAQRLCSELGYRLSAAGVIDMFPQTAHVEAMALFTRA
ncbi:MAG: 23S rRNA (uracil(1939)-C(5))-methyltransferase RlmD [Gammaproteobacteria bacterium]